MHTEALTAWRQLVEVRFKLLALVPAVSVLALSQILDFKSSQTSPERWARVGVAIVGLVVLVGLAIYDRRNSELHDDLISRVRRAEAELGIHTGIALGRKDPKGFVRHKVPIGLIYGVTLIAWIGAALGLFAHAVRCD